MTMLDQEQRLIMGDGYVKSTCTTRTTHTPHVSLDLKADVATAHRRHSGCKAQFISTFPLATFKCASSRSNPIDLLSEVTPKRHGFALFGDGWTTRPFASQHGTMFSRDKVPAHDQSLQPTWSRAMNLNTWAIPPRRITASTRQKKAAHKCITNCTFVVPWRSWVHPFP